MIPLEKKTMQTIDIKKIIDSHNLTAKEVAESLFPDNKYPKLALNRVMAGEALLNSDQISKLSLLTSTPIAQIFTYESWTNATTRKNVLTLSNGNYVAELHLDDWTTKLFDKGSLFHSFVLHKSAVTLKDYIQILNTEIDKQKST